MKEILKEKCDKYYEIFTREVDIGYEYRYLSPFEFKDILMKEATESSYDMLNAGRGNPDFFCTLPRYAFSILSLIAVEIGDGLHSKKDIGVMPTEAEVSDMFYIALQPYKEIPVGKFLNKCINKMVKICHSSNIPKEKFLHDLVVSTIGCFYPNPPRVQNFAEPILIEFLEKKIYRSTTSLRNKIKVFPTEGAANAILYVFNSLKYNNLVVEGDKIGVFTPIFSPYLEIPSLQNYALVQVCIEADEDNMWNISRKQLDKLKDTSIKAIFMVNPANPTSVSYSKQTLDYLKNVVEKHNPNLIILTDNVYAPFVNEFNTLFNTLPRNTIGIYSFSKYFGTTGLRLGVIAMYDDNIIDNKLLKKAPKKVHERYTMLTTHPATITFIDRLLDDSRQVAEAHVAGLSTTQQVQMCLFSVFDLLDTKEVYKNKLKNILIQRSKNFLTPLGKSVSDSNLDANYYITIDMLKVSKTLFKDDEFPKYLLKHKDPLEFLILLARNYGTVLLPAVGFAGPFWGVRVSLANLANKDYTDIGNNVKALLQDYYSNYVENK